LETHGGTEGARIAERADDVARAEHSRRRVQRSEIVLVEQVARPQRDIPAARSGTQSQLQVDQSVVRDQRVLRIVRGVVALGLEGVLDATEGRDTAGADLA